MPKKIDDSPKVEVVCLKCNRKHMSKSKFLRICPGCTEKNAKIPTYKNVAPRTNHVAGKEGAD